MPLNVLRHAVLAAGAAALALAGCSSDGSAEGDDAPAESDSADFVSDSAGETKASFPVALETHYGEVTVEERPERVVSLLGPYTDVAVALDANVVAMADFSLDGSLFPWLEGEISYGEDGAVNLGDPYAPIGFEQIAQAEPDLILASMYQVTDGESYQRLASIAPTYVSVGETSNEDSWQLSAENIGALLGESERAAALIEDVETQIADLASATPGNQGKSALYVGHIAEGFYPVTGAENPATELLASLGFVVPDQLVDHPDQEMITPENTDMLESDVLFYILQDGAPISATGPWEELSAVRNGTAQELDIAAGNALIGPSVLNIPYLLESIEPTLEAAEEF